jgi:hypothetical protein
LSLESPTASNRQPAERAARKRKGVSALNTNQSLAGNQNNRGIWVFGLACGVPLLAAVVMAALFMTGAPGFTSLQQNSPTSATVEGAQKLNVTIVTNAGPHHNWPAFEPATIAIPANHPVTITVTDLDGSTPLTSSLRSYSKVTGVVGDDIEIVPIRVDHPRTATGAAREVDAVNASVVSHTFTIPSLGINVPLLGSSRTSFTIEIAKPGIYTWECFDPCGSGAGGFGAPMGLTGYMLGTVTASVA